MTSIHLYAELLLNIRTVTLFASLKSEHNHETKATLYEDGESITVTHEGETATLRLPTKIKGNASAALTLPAKPSKEITLRLQLEEKAPGLLKYSDFQDSRTENPVPWNASDLGRGVELACAQCGHALVARGVVAAWKNLPHEHWAEMMDFWHCHKPDDHHGHDHTLDYADDAPSRKGYAAANKLAATGGTGFVDVTYFLLAQEDCCGAKTKEKSAEASNDAPEILCASCSETIGVADPLANGLRCFKSAVAVVKDGTTERHEPSLWTAAQLLTAYQHSGLRRFIVQRQDKAGADDGHDLMIWVFTIDLDFSSSIASSDRKDPTRAMKIFYQYTDRGDEILQHQSESFDGVKLPLKQFKTFEDALHRNRALLPSSARKFQDWHVSLLERFEDRAPRRPKNPIDPLYE